MQGNKTKKPIPKQLSKTAVRFSSNRQPSKEAKRQGHAKRAARLSIQEDLKEELLKIQFVSLVSGEKISGYEALKEMFLDIVLNPSTKIYPKDRANLIIKAWEIMFGKPQIQINQQFNENRIEYTNAELISLARKALEEKIINVTANSE